MTRKKKLFLNTTISLTNQVITLLCGFILPRLFLSYYGSAVNGLVSSITQFLGFISLCECGVGAVVQSALYTPLSRKDDREISKIVLSAERFFHKLAVILCIYTLVLMVGYPFITQKNFDYFYTMALIFVISIQSFMQYYFGMTYRLLLNADQRGFVQLGTHCLTVVGNTVACSFLMMQGASVQLVKLTTSIIFMIQPLVLTVYVRRHYRIERSIVLTEEPIKQKWNGLAQHIATVVLGNTDSVVLTLFSTLENVSIYAVYNLVITGVKQILTSLTAGISAMLGNMLAKKEYELLEETFSYFEWLMHSAVTLVFTVTGLLLVPFVQVYTRNITDANYIVPLFAALLTMAQGMYCIRLPYNIMVLAAGHYKQTQASAIFEAGLNLIISVLAVFRFGLVGVAAGTLAAMAYRTGYFAWYLSQNILKRKLSYFVKHLVIDGISVGLMIITGSGIALHTISYFGWFCMAVKIFSLCFAECILINLLFYRDKMKKCEEKGRKERNENDCLGRKNGSDHRSSRFYWSKSGDGAFEDRGFDPNYRD